MIREHKFGDLLVLQLAVLHDNYSYIIHEQSSGATAVLDPADDPQIVAELRRRGWSLEAIWNTHWHADHCGGNRELLQYNSAEVLAYSRKNIPECSRELRSGDCVRLGQQEFQVYEVPGHTQDHLAFCYESASPNLLFSGDALFALGCGRLFEGTAAQLWQTMQLFRSFPDHSLLFCAHEYTRANLRFALSLEKENPVLQQFARQLALPENHGMQTIPSNLGFEKQANPFLRVQEIDFSQSVRQQIPDWDIWTAEQRLADLRKRKDHFRS